MTRSLEIEKHHNFGDSITAGVGATATTSYFHKVAQDKGRDIGELWSQRNYLCKSTEPRRYHISFTMGQVVSFETGTRQGLYLLLMGITMFIYQLLGNRPSVAGFQSKPRNRYRFR